MFFIYRPIRIRSGSVPFQIIIDPDPHQWIPSDPVNWKEKQKVRNYTRWPAPHSAARNLCKRQCCGSGMLIPDPDFPHPGSRISDPRSKNSNKRKGWKKIVVIPFFVATNLTKLKIIVFFEMLKKKKLDQFSQNYRTFYPKNCHYALKNMGLGSGIRDPGSGKNIIRIQDPGVKKAPDTRSGSATLDGGWWVLTSLDQLNKYL